jgi:uncharacterized delta-60 repeat protein
MRRTCIFFLLAGIVLGAPRAVPQIPAQPVINPGFESGTAPWHFFTNGAGSFSDSATGYASAHAGCVAITAQGSNTQLYQADLSLTAGYRYRLRFRAYSTTGHNLSVSLHKHTAPYTSYGLEHASVELTTEWQSFSFEFVSSGFTGSVNDARLRFWLAPYDADGDKYIIDDVELLRLRPESESVISWVTSCGGPWYDELADVRQTADGGYIAAGSTWSAGSGYSDFWIVKFRVDGSIEWQNVYGGTVWDLATSLELASDGGYVIAGWTESFGAGERDAWIVKLNPDGTIDWQRTYGGSGSDQVSSIRRTADGGYVAAGWTESYGAGSRDAWVLKLSATGSVEWQKSYGGTSYEEASCIRQITDGGYILAGRTDSYGAGLWDAWVLRLNADGSVRWQKAYGRSDREMAHSAQQTADLGFIVSGSRGADAWVCKLDGEGSVTWQKTCGGAGVDNYFSAAVQQTRDGDYIVAGHTSSFGAGSQDAWLLKFGADGALSWQMTYGEGGWEGVGSVQQTRDGGYICAGSTLSFGSGNSDGWILKVDSLGNSGHCPAAKTSQVVVSPAILLVTNTNLPASTTPGVASTTAVLPGNSSARAWKICPASYNLVSNGGFENGTAPWKFFTDGLGSFSVDASGPASPGAAHLTVATPGANMQLYQPGLHLQPNVRCRLSFRARSTSGHDLSVHLHKHTAPYTSYGVSNWTVDLTPDWQQFAQVFTTGGFTSAVDDGRLRFWLVPWGAAGDEYFIDDVELVWVGPAKEMQQVEIPGSPMLLQNYPNPFNPATTIQFTLVVRQATTVRVYDVLGREVATLVNEVKEPGTYTVQWNASGVSSGVYFYRLRAGDFVQTKRMMIVK